MPRTKKNYNGNVYKDATILPGIYASLSDPDKVAFRFAYNQRSSHKDSDYYYVNGDGTLFPLNKAFVTFLTYAYKKIKKKKFILHRKKENLLLNLNRLLMKQQVQQK